MLTQSETTSYERNSNTAAGLCAGCARVLDDDEVHICAKCDRTLRKEGDNGGHHPSRKEN